MDYKANSKCWTCTKCYKQCSWSKYFIPVKGWTAKKLIFKTVGLPDVESYEVLDCPEYEKEAPRKKIKRFEG